MLWIERVSPGRKCFYERVFEELDILPLFGPEISNL